MKKTTDLAEEIANMELEEEVEKPKPFKRDKSRKSSVKKILKQAK